MDQAPPTVIMSPSRHSSPRVGAIRCVVLHHTAGTNSLAYLTKNPQGVSAHVLIRKDGTVYRMVPDERAAHTVGRSNIGRYTVAPGDAGNANDITLNIELENLGVDADPYPPEQVSACAWQVAQWWKAHGDLPVLTHELIDTEGKTDPRGFDLVAMLRHALRWYDDSPLFMRYTADSPIIAAPRATLEQLQATVPHGQYEAREVRESFVPNYWNACRQFGLDPVLCIAQMLHETGGLTSFWSAPPQRNPAGIGVNGVTQASAPLDPTGWAQKPDGTWAMGISFPTWPLHAIPAHVARLLAYATAPASRTPAQTTYILAHARSRPLPDKAHGSAPVLRMLGKVHNPSGLGWASPGTAYGASIATWANKIGGL